MNKIDHKTFRQRVDSFWDWFSENEQKLSDIVEQRGEMDTEQIVSFISEGVGILSADVQFHIGGDYEFTFAAEGNAHLFYLMPFVVSRMPARFEGKWKFFPYMQSAHGKSFGFGMYGKKIDIDQVMVLAQYDQEEDFFSVRFYEPQLCALKESDAYNAFYIMMEITIGEGLSRIYVDTVTLAEQKEEGMISLNTLEQHMTDTIAAAGKELLSRPDERYSVYQIKKQTDDGPREDIFVGSTCFTELLNGFYSGDGAVFSALETHDAKAAFLMFAYPPDMDRRVVLEDRHAIEDRFECEVLKKRGSGDETGVLLGAAMGERNAYIDLLLYDEPAFLEAAKKVLQKYPYPFYMVDYQKGAVPVLLCSGNGER